MKLFALMLALSSVVSFGSGTRWITVDLPTHVLHVDEGDSGGVTKLPCVTSSSTSFERQIGLMNSPYIPHHTNWNIPADVNLISLYGIKVSGVFDLKNDPKSPKLIIVIDCAKSVRPEGYPYTVDEVVEKVKRCVKLNFHSEGIQVLLKKDKGEEKGGMGLDDEAVEARSGD